LFIIYSPDVTVVSVSVESNDGTSDETSVLNEAIFSGDINVNVRDKIIFSDEIILI